MGFRNGGTRLKKSTPRFSAAARCFSSFYFESGFTVLFSLLTLSPLTLLVLVLLPLILPLTTGRYATEKKPRWLQAPRRRYLQRPQ